MCLTDPIGERYVRVVSDDSTVCQSVVVVATSGVQQLLGKTVAERLRTLTSVRHWWLHFLKI